MSKKYLIVKIAAIGDVIMALPMVNEIRKQDKDAEITWVCGRGVKSLLEPFAIDRIITVDEKKLMTGSRLEKISVVINLWRQIAGRRYDVVALGHAARRYKILTLLTRCGEFRFFSHVMGERWPVPGRHHTDEYVRLVKPNNKTPIAAVQFPQVDLPSRLTTLLSGGRPIAALAPGGAKNLLADDDVRRWPIENYANLAKQLIKKGYGVVITGANADKWVEGYFADIPVINLIGKTNLLELIGVFQHVDVIITHDSGPMHLAGMTGTKLITIFGPTNPWEKVPRRENVTTAWGYDKNACCPCYDGKYYAKCDEKICMEKITVEYILGEI
ncbi:glycosyltransferase family 9 protein [Selenomonas caprae]|uniref:Glycosyltransferase family 9 protein n=1 Tax=Selenomonas caprae TaxID=2606905 RepID=A0A5D6WPQ9_9FIRM|nr:glycosyltransferase family 9 protein [Selenomonas caprae]TYZ29830.1 glycosyltransferase family 9 protein [Selenomonas caprae]